MAIGAASRPPGSTSLSSSPKAIYRPNVDRHGLRLSGWALTIVMAIATATSIAAPDSSARRPVSTVCQPAQR